jgi:hypothetical protein
LNYSLTSCIYIKKSLINITLSIHAYCPRLLAKGQFVEI